MKEENEDLLIAMLPEIPVFLVAVLWSIVAIMTHYGFIGLLGLAVLYRRYARYGK